LNRHEEAILPARKSLNLQPDDLNTRWVYYRALMVGAGDTTEALTQLELIAKADPNPLMAYDGMIRIHRSRQDRPTVVHTLDRIASLPDLSERDKLVAAQNFQLAGANAKAERLLINVLAKNPARSDAWVKLANLQVIRGDTLSGARSLRSALQNQNERVNPMPIWRQLANIYGPKARIDSLLTETPADARFQEQLGEFYRQLARTDDPKKAVPLLERALLLFNHLTQASPGRADLFAKQGELFLNLNRPVDARNAFIHAAKLDNRPEYHLGRAHSLLFEQLYDPAIKILESIKPKMVINSEFLDRTILSLGNAYAATGKNETARRLYKESIANAPENAAYRHELGETYIRDGNWNEATQTFKDLLPFVETDQVTLGRTLYGLARTLERSGEFEESVRTFERLLSLHPNHADALNYLGYMFAEKGVRLGEAASFIQRALETDPNNGAYLDSLGWVFYQSGNYRQAQNYLKRALDQEEAELSKLGQGETARRKAMKENLAVINDHAGDCALELNQFDTARKHWERALKYDQKIDNTENKLTKLNRNHSPRTEGDVAP
jgi:tetratricopeptide (TPR) repeat protein